jgi:hypothetical protein
MYKLAAATIQMGSAKDAGKGIADIVVFLMGRINQEKRREAIIKLRTKIWNLNENEISSKKTPPSASYGTALTFIKTILNGHKPDYVRAVLSNIVRNLY